MGCPLRKKLKQRRWKCCNEKLMNNRSLSFLKYASQLSFFADGIKVLPTTLGALWTFDALFFVGDSPNKIRYIFLLLGITLFLIGLFSLYFGYQKNKVSYDNGLEIQGKIIAMYFRFGYGLITCEHFYQGQIYRSSHRVNRFRWEKILKPGQEIMLIMDKNNPQKIFVRDFYK